MQVHLPYFQIIQGDSNKGGIREAFKGRVDSLMASSSAKTCGAD